MCTVCRKGIFIHLILWSPSDYHLNYREALFQSFQNIIHIGILLDSAEQAEKLTQLLSAEGIACGPTSACGNLTNKAPIVTRQMVNPANAPFGPGFNGENVTYGDAANCPNCDKVWERYCCIGIGPLFTDADVDDILEALEKCLPIV